MGLRYIIWNFIIILHLIIIIISMLKPPSNLLFEARLTKSERLLIKKVARLQLESLTRILENSAEGVDVPIYAQLEGIDLDRLHRETRKSLRSYERCLIEPQAFLSLDESNMSICKHLILGHLMEHKGRKRLFRKIRVIEKYPFHLN
jgi:hypothetical protein